MLGLAAWWWMTGRGDDGSLRRVREAERFRVGYAVEAPFAFVDATGRVTGEAPEVARRVAAQVGLERLEWRQYEFGELIGALEDHEIDMVAAGMFVSAERAVRVRFSRPTCRVAQGLLVLAGNPRGLHSYGDIAGRGARVAIVAGSVEESLLEATGVPAERRVRVPDAAAGRAAVVSGFTDGLALSAPTIRWMLANGRAEGLEMAEPFEPMRQDGEEVAGYPAFVFRRGDRTLGEAWDRVLETFLGSMEHRELVRPFGIGEDELVHLTVKDVL
ncbi:MAG: transporter substrate-binding domain-containing protein [Verrucomicrobiae bacterium]|nr:transporter substrate-binding domain-containing protein [Verrucomicrobiae bacterium]